MRVSIWLLLFPGLVWCVLGCPLAVRSWAQLSVPAQVPTAVQPETSKDALGRTTPRGTVLGFLKAAHNGDNELAAQYLDTRLRGKAAEERAHQLFVVLDRRLPPKLGQVSDSPEGSLSDPRKKNEDLVGTISSAKGDVPIYVERVDRGKSGFLWLFSSKTLDSIPDLYQEINVVPVETALPPFLVTTRVAGISLFQWLAGFVGVPLFYILTVLLNRLLNPLIGLACRRIFQNPSLPNPNILPNPVRFLLMAAAIHWALVEISLPLFARQFWSNVASAITIAACVWLLILLNSRGEGYIRRHLRSHNQTGALSIVRLTRTLLDLLVFLAGVLVALHHWGIKATPALAGLGVGGIAVALAAQKTLENVVGGVSLIFDHAVRVGETLKVGDTVGMVEDIGLRSIRIRTLDRTIVSIPNGQISNMSLEIISLRDKFWFHPILMENIEAAGVQIALPSQTIFLSSASTLDECGGHKVVKAPTSEQKIGNRIAARKSA
jgi:MscS family membrane protein